MTRYASLFVLGLFVLSMPAAAFAAIENMDIGGDVRTLFFWSENDADFDDDYDDQTDFARLEAHLWFEASLADNVKAKISLEADRDWESTIDIEGNETGTNSIDFSGGNSSDLNVFLEEAWIKVMYAFDSPLSLTLGRQFIEYGDGLVIGDSQPGVPILLSNIGEWEQDPFDAVVANLDWEEWVLDLLWAKTVEERQFDQDGDLYGAHLTYSGLETHIFSVYYFFMRTEFGDGRFSLPEGKEDIHVAGLRAEGQLVIPELAYVAEIAGQFGEVEGSGDDDADISAWALHLGAEWRPEHEWSPFVNLHYYLLSGDDDEDLEGEWRSMFSNHTYGEIGENWIITNSHIINLGLGADSLGAEGKWSAGVQAYLFLLYEDESDPFGEASYATLRVEDSHYGYDLAKGIIDDEDTDDFAGWEVDAYVGYQFSESLSTKLTAGIFSPEDGLEAAFGDDDLDEALFVRGEVGVKF